MSYKPELKELKLEVSFEYYMTIDELVLEMERQNVSWQNGIMNGHHLETEEEFFVEAAQTKFEKLLKPYGYLCIHAKLPEEYFEFNTNKKFHIIPEEENTDG